MTEEQAVKAVVTAFLDNYGAKNVDGCVACLAQSCPLLLMGTNVDEVFTSVDQVRAALGRDFAAMSGLAVGAVRRLQVATGGDLASALLEVPLSYVADGQSQCVPFRYALVLVRESGGWKISGGIASVAAGAGSYSFS